MNLEQSITTKKATTLVEFIDKLRHVRTFFIKNESEFLGDSFFELSDQAIRDEVIQILTHTRYTALLTESGIGLNRNLLAEATSRVGLKLFPPPPDKTELRTYINELFHHKDDHEWVQAIPDEKWAKLFESAIGSQPNSFQLYVIKEALNAVQVLAQRAAALGIEPEIVSQLPRVDDWDSPFLGLNREVIHYVEKLARRSSYAPEDRLSDYRQILIMIKQCRAEMAELEKHRDRYGISLRMTYSIHRLGQSLNRLERLLKILEAPTTTEFYLSIVPLFKDLVQAENTKFSIGKYLSQNLQVLTYRVVENTSKVGEHYIAETKKEYWKLFRKAIGGGVVVAFLCGIKSRIYFAQFPIFWEAFFYSMNYAVGFIIIHLLGFTLATKQPAMTASTIAATLSNNGTNASWLTETTDLLIKLIRSQFISLLGNALVAFPIAYSIDQLYFHLKGHHITNIAKAHHMIHELNLWESLAIPHAAIAGCYLMLSGLISGYYENNWLYTNMTNRVANQPFLKKVLGVDRLNHIAHYMENNIGGIAGNFVLGILLGATSAIGFTIGLPLDIRHITFASGNFGIAASSLGNSIPNEIWVNSIIGIVGIGIINVIVSFGLSILFALNSRNTRFSEARSLFYNLGWNFVHKGLAFFYPIDEKKKPKEEQ